MSCTFATKQARFLSSWRESHSQEFTYSLVFAPNQDGLEFKCSCLSVIKLSAWSGCSSKFGDQLKQKVDHQFWCYVHDQDLDHGMPKIFLILSEATSKRYCRSDLIFCRAFVLLEVKTASWQRRWRSTRPLWISFSGSWTQGTTTGACARNPSKRRRSFPTSASATHL